MCDWGNILCPSLFSNDKDEKVKEQIATQVQMARDGKVNLGTQTMNG